MDVNKILSSNYLDIVFEGRNKQYGGYELRRNYSKRVRKSLFVILALCIFSSSYSFINIKLLHDKPITKREPPTWHELHIDPKRLSPPPSPPPPMKPTTKITPPIIRRDDDVREEDALPQQSEIIASGPMTHDGDADGIYPDVDKEPGTSISSPPPTPTIFNYVEQMPAAAYDYQDYLNQHIVYPDAARESNIEGRVIVKFVVNEDGAISDVQVVRGIGGGCDEEAKRVVASFPKWKPGKQNGKPVKVYFTLPIVFKLQ